MASDRVIENELLQFYMYISNNKNNVPWGAQSGVIPLITQQFAYY